MDNDLLHNLDKIHTTKLGEERIKNNLDLETSDVVAWCKEEIKRSENQDIIRKGKNWYVETGEAVITINANSFTIITAHKGKLKHKKS